MPYRPLLLVLILVLVASCGPELAVRPAEPPTPTAAPTRTPYDPADLKTVERRDLLDTVTGRASIVPKLTDELFFLRDGRIGSIDAAAGDEVKQGQVLARLEQTDLLYQIDLARIDVELAELQERQAREKRLPAVDLAIAAKEVERTQLALERLETERKSLEITAPYAGRVSEIELKPGQEIKAYDPVATIVGTEELIVVAEFSAPDAARIKVGQEVALADYFDAKIAFNGVIVGQTSATGTSVVVEPQAGAPDLKLGDTFKVTVVLGRAPGVLAIPADSVKSIGDRRYVLLVDQGELRRVYVETGVESEGLVEIRSGLEEGQQVSAR